MATWVITIAEHHPGCAQFVTFTTLISNMSPLEFIENNRQHNLEGAPRRIALINAWKDTELV